MFRSLQGPVPICTVVVAAAILLAVRDDKVANLVIAAAVVLVTVTAVAIILERRIFDAYDEGKRAERRALAREVVDLRRRG